jgi:hypothetical protein
MIFIIFLEIFKFNKYIGMWGYGVVNFGCELRVHNRINNEGYKGRV